MKKFPSQIKNQIKNQINNNENLYNLTENFLFWYAYVQKLNKNGNLILSYKLM